MTEIFQMLAEPSQWTEEYKNGVYAAAIIIILVANIICMLIKKHVFAEGFNLVSGGLWGGAFLIVLVICAVLLLFLWFAIDTWTESFFGKALALIFFGSIHAVGLLFAVILGVYAIVLVIGCFLVYCFFAGASESASSSELSDSMTQRYKDEKAKEEA